jgi:hypothetical protein
MHACRPAAFNSGCAEHVVACDCVLLLHRCCTAAVLQKLLDLAKKPLSVQETWETRYEQLMEQFASDMRLYMGMVSRCVFVCVLGGRVR